MRQKITYCLAIIKNEIVLCVAFCCAAASMFFVPPSRDYLSYIDFRVIVLLFCLMVVVAGFQKCGAFSVIAQKLLAGRKRMRLLLLILVFMPFFASMLITNDVALIAFVPFSILILTLIGRTKYLIRIVVLQTIAANLGSMAMPVGNPQNLFLYAKYNLSPGAFFATTLPLTLLSLIGLFIATLCVHRETIEVHFSTQARLQNPKLLLLFVGLFCLCLLSVFRLLHFGILAGIIVVCLLFCDRTLFGEADYGLLLTFVCFFIFAGNIGQIESVRNFLAGVMASSTLLTSVAASQVISNVPAAVLLSGFTEDWQGLLIGTNIGGLGTPIASLASLISLKFYMKAQGARPMRYIAVFLLANFAGLLVLYPFSMLI